MYYIFIYKVTNVNFVLPSLSAEEIFVPEALMFQTRKRHVCKLCKIDDWQIQLTVL